MTDFIGSGLCLPWQHEFRLSKRNKPFKFLVATFHLCSLLLWKSREQKLTNAFHCQMTPTTGLVLESPEVSLRRQTPWYQGKKELVFWTSQEPYCCWMLERERERKEEGEKKKQKTQPKTKNPTKNLLMLLRSFGLWKMNKTLHLKSLCALQQRDKSLS